VITTIVDIINSLIIIPFAVSLYYFFSQRFNQKRVIAFMFICYELLKISVTTFFGLKGISLIWISYFEPIIATGLLLGIITPNTLGLGIKRTQAILFMVACVFLSSVIDYTKADTLMRFAVMPNTIGAFVIICMSYISRKYRVENSRVVISYDPVYWISTALYAYYTMTIIIIMLYNTILSWGNDALSVAFLMNKIFYLVLIIIPFSLALTKNKWD
jgi:hypothetical protein